MFITFLFGLTILLGTIIILLFKRKKKISELSISIAFSVLFCLIFLEVIPHTLEHIDYLSMIMYALIGFILLKLLDIFIPDHEHSNHKEHVFHIGLMSSIALIIHNFIEGMILYSTLNKNFNLGILLGIGIGLHNIPLGMVIGSTLKDAKYNKLKIILISLIISLSTFVGSFVIYLIGDISQYFIGVMFAITLGMLIYIVFFELLEHLKHQNKNNNITGFIIGAIIICISLIFHHH